MTSNEVSFCEPNRPASRTGDEMPDEYLGSDSTKDHINRMIVAMRLSEVATLQEVLSRNPQKECS